MTGIKNDKCFTFLWKLENINYCLQKKGEEILSPAFVVDEIHKTKWNLIIFPRGKENGNYISCFLRREPDSKGEDTVEVKYELAFIGESGLILASCGSSQRSFSKGKCIGYSEFKKREDVFIFNRSTFLPKDTLRARCRVWKNVGEMAENVHCFARTRIGVEKRSFVWNLEDFSTFEPGRECTYLIQSPEKDAKLMTLNLCLDGGQNCEEMIHFKLTNHNQNIKYCALRLFLVDIHGRQVECNQDDFWLDKLGDIQHFTFNWSRQELMRKKSLYLPSDILSLHWEWAFSKGVVSEEIEKFIVD